MGVNFLTPAVLTVLSPALIVILIIVGILVGSIFGYILRVKLHEKSFNAAKHQSEKMLTDAQLEAERLHKESIQETKRDIAQLKHEADLDIKERKKNIVELENKVYQREEAVDKRSSNLDRREELLANKETKIDEKKLELEQLNLKVEEVLKQQERKLSEIATLSKEEAKEIIMTRVRDDVSLEITTFIKDEEEKARAEAKIKSKNILSLAMQKYASETVVESTVSVVSLPADEMKGRLIGREGRNIRAIEALTGVDLIIDDTPEAVVLSGFDPVRRDIAKRTVEILVSDGRIHPARIEEVVERCRSEVEMLIREKGEEVVFKTGIGKIHPDLVRLIGRLHYRTSYGQNVLNHSMEVAFLSGKMAAEIGENELVARRAGLLHDIGKAVDHEIEGSHVDIGVELASKYREGAEVIDAIASHHEDVAPKSIIAVLVAAADALSSARSGARSDSLENYTKRLEALEQISNNIKGVQSSYAIQAGREVRVIVNPEEIDDLSTVKIARQIKEEIESKLSYPGTIKVTVIRETRAVDLAK